MDTQRPPPSNGEATQYALRVALQTMKDRCLVLQKRLNILEDENQQLRSGRDDYKSTLPTASVGFAAENFQLRLQLAEIQRQKTQLTEQMNMVSTENRQLWSRLSQMAKDQCIENSDNMRKNQNFEREVVNQQNGANGQNNLIRSKTFTQHSPNPNLRLKNISNYEVAETCNPATMEELNLEEVVLTAGDETIKLVDTDLGFSYLNIDEGNFGESGNISDQGFQIEAKKCTEALNELKNEALQQQKELKAALNALHSRIVQPCPECIQKSKKPEMADKSLETDESLRVELAEIAETNVKNLSASHKTEHNNHTNPRINFIQEKIECDARLKTCPMCGKLYNDSITFQAFCEHVESHFNSETSDFASMENDFECVSNTIGNF